MKKSTISVALAVLCFGTVSTGLQSCVKATTDIATPSVPTSGNTSLTFNEAGSSFKPITANNTQFAYNSNFTSYTITASSASGTFSMQMLISNTGTYSVSSSQGGDYDVVSTYSKVSGSTAIPFATHFDSKRVGSGTVNITKKTSTEVAGTFNFELKSQDGRSSSTISSGSFSTKF